jgi:hypothetical protein
VDWVTDDVRVSLHTAAYVPDQDTHDFFLDATNEVSTSGTNYSQQSLGTKSINYDAPTKTTQFRAANTTFANLTAVFRYAVIFKWTGSASTSPLMGWVDVGAQSVSATNFVIDWSDTDGVLKGVVS